MAFAAGAQNRGIVKAIVLDSATRQPVQLATISILKLSDTSLIAYTVTDKDGSFSLRNLKQEPSRLIISHVGFRAMHYTIDFNKGAVVDLGKLYLLSKMLQEVTVKGERVPVVMKKDTLEFDAEAFKTRPNAVVEDLLRKLPGIQIDHDGHITVNGKEISKIKINDKDFFVNDPKIATRNLEADMISKVQVYDDRENDPDHIVPDNEVKKIINLKFKKKFTDGFMGNAEADAGTDHRYKGKAFFSKFDNKGNLGFNLNTNNLSGTDVFDSDNHTDPMSSSKSDITTTTNGTLSFSNEFSKKFKLGGNYGFNINVTDNKTTTQTQQFIGDTIFTTAAGSIGHNRSGSQGVSFNTEWNPDTINKIKFTPSVNYFYNSGNSMTGKLSASNFASQLSNNYTSNNSSGNGLGYRYELNLYHKLHKKGGSISVSNSQFSSPNNSTSFSVNGLLSYVAGLPTDTLNRYSKRSSNYSGHELNASLHYPIGKKIVADITLTENVTQSGGDAVTYQQDLKTGLYNIFLPDLSNDLIRKGKKDIATPAITYKFTDKIYLKAGFIAQVQQINNHFNDNIADVDQHYFNVLPTAELHINHLGLSYLNRLRLPSLNDMQPITIVYSPLYTFTGNPNLKPTRTQIFNLNYFNFTKSQLSISAFSSLLFDSNSVLNERTVNTDGAEVATPVNRKGRLTANFYSFVNKRFKKRGKWQITESTGLNETYGHNYFEVNGQSGYQNTNSINLRQEISLSYNNVLDVKSAYNINYALTRYQLVNLPNNGYTTQAASIAAYLRLPNRYSWDVNYVYRYNPLVSPGFQRNSNLLSVSIARRMLKGDRGEFRITCYDLLNEGITSSHYASENMIDDTQYQILRRYFLFSYFYRFNDFKKK